MSKDMEGWNTGSIGRGNTKDMENVRKLQTYRVLRGVGQEQLYLGLRMWISFIWWIEINLIS
jgi:hypothetical protein